VKFIDERKGHRVGPNGLRRGVESICAVLTQCGAAIAPSTYYDAAGGCHHPKRCAMRI
jgi:putative transposase